MQEFYHRELNVDTTKVPRILGLTASLIKSKGILVHVVIISWNIFIRNFG